LNYELWNQVCQTGRGPAQVAEVFVEFLKHKASGGPLRNIPTVTFEPGEYWEPGRAYWCNNPNMTLQYVSGDPSARGDAGAIASIFVEVGAHEVGHALGLLSSVCQTSTCPPSEFEFDTYCQKWSTHYFPPWIDSLLLSCEASSFQQARAAFQSVFGHLMGPYTWPALDHKFNREFGDAVSGIRAMSYLRRILPLQPEPK
jgi:hypothetical protein